MKVNPDDFRYDGSREFKIKELETKISDIYKDKDDYKEILADNADELDDLQSMMYAHNRYGLLVIFQAMDAAGKDGTLKRVFAGVNPIGVRVHSFKRPSENELQHDFMWRTSLLLPQRGSITVFNRSYYEEVLVVKVHAEIVTNVQRLPHELTENMYNLWEQRYQDIKNSENYLYNNGIRVVKFFLNVSKKEQAERLIDRIDDPEKNWKFEEGDVKEREFWDDYQQAYEEAINATGTETAPWYVIPADDKKNMRLIVGQIIAEELKKMDMKYPESDEKRYEELQRFVEIIKGQN
ncbi:polyphosphate kinase 2 family protein [Persicitalea jodogahamensis]|uniref:Polyphosphate--nucleotide phosphotransferase n=1 Tax=Persicitalea jodogahamensis TaxID=402147 RepID=A0A8J3G9D3_9BACT|nr:polyphosphate kinase 2 family protein [Persicitalea jodogahamensis]GHB71964.1 polyphosphate--nucleotide phosphotransferase [Persicitalea jodogahamensis]